MVSEKTYIQVALEEPEGQWELHCGRLRRKPDMAWAHNHLARVLGYRLQSQLSHQDYEVSVNIGKVSRSPRTYYMPDVVVIPTAAMDRFRARPGTFELYAEPMPLVVEVWSPSTGEDDVDEKFPEYQRRGDLEIWRIHPFERTLTAWRRQPDGSYTETRYTGGEIQPVALPNVTIDLDALFAD